MVLKKRSPPVPHDQAPFDDSFVSLPAYRSPGRELSPLSLTPAASRDGISFSVGAQSENDFWRML
jgi:hypothetical protein